MSVLTSNNTIREHVGRRAAKVIQNPKPSKRTALGSITNVQSTKDVAPFKGTSAPALPRPNYGNVMKMRTASQPFEIHVDKENKLCKEEVKLKSEVLNLCEQDVFESAESNVSPMAVSPCISDVKEDILATEENLDSGNSELEYEDDILKYLKTLEVETRPRVGYMNKQQDINHKMRSILVDWLVEVSEEFKLRDQTLYLSVSYIDRFLSVMSVLRSKLQLVGTACMLLATKFEEIYAPEVSDFVYITDDTYTSKQLLKMEQLVLKTLGYNLSSPTAINFLEIYLIAAGCERTDIEEDKSTKDDIHSKLNYLARYLCELTLMDANTFLKYLPSTIAAASVSLAARTLGLPSWCEELQQKTALTLADIKGCKSDLVTLFQIASTSSHESVRVKYSTKKYHNVSKIKIKEDFAD